MAGQLADRFAPVDHAMYARAVARRAAIGEEDAENSTSTYEELEYLAGEALAWDDSATIEDLATRTSNDDDAET